MPLSRNALRNMGNLLLVDSNYYIGISRAGGDPFEKLGAMADGWDVATCGMVIMEVLRGVRSEKARRYFETAFSCMIYMATLNSVWEKAAQLAWTLDRKGRVLPATDLIIAACALSQDAALLTFDCHFTEIPGLRLVRDWN